MRDWKWWVLLGVGAYLFSLPRSGFGNLLSELAWLLFAVAVAFAMLMVVSTGDQHDR